MSGGGGCRFLLRGEIGGCERSYLLRPGLNRVGRLDANHVVLEVDGLSKRHAALLIEPGRITVQDLASKNGTFVNGRRVVDAEVRPGDEVGFGPVRLTLHAAAPGETELAIELAAGSSTAAPRLDGETTLTASGTGGQDGWRAVLRFPDGHVAGESAPMRELYRQMAAVARSELPVLIAGETGVGKEAVARTLHASSPRAGRPLAAVNCAAIPRELLEAELFGVAVGAATGVAPRPGVFRAADGGTVLLDEIGEMPLGLQSKLLRALEEKEVQPVGGAPAPADVRVLAATNAGLSESLDRGRFRRDLYYRLAGCVLRVPALSERREDVPLLVEHFLRRAAREAGSGVRGLTAGALRRLCEHPWPGNVRELEHLVRRLVYLAAGSEAITEERVAGALGAEIETPAGGAGPAAAGGDLDLAALERRAVTEALRRSGGNQERAARLLGISRFALRRRLERHGLAGAPR